MLAAHAYSYTTVPEVRNPSAITAYSLHAAKYFHLQPSCCKVLSLTAFMLQSTFTYSLHVAKYFHLQPLCCKVLSLTAFMLQSTFTYSLHVGRQTFQALVCLVYLHPFATGTGHPIRLKQHTSWAYAYLPHTHLVLFTNKTVLQLTAISAKQCSKQTSLPWP